ncbi:MAG: hypothetical protein AAB255_02480 [Bacteroidota bacterium]
MIKYFFISIFYFQIIFAQSPNSFKFDAESESHLSNSVTDIIAKGDSLILGTGKGLSISPNGGLSWKNFFNTNDFAQEDISAMSINKNEFWIATAHSENKNDEYLPVGSGIRFSNNGGATWISFEQPTDINNIDTLQYGINKIRAIGVTTKVYNLCYDIAASDSAIYIASFAGMLRKSIDKGITWSRVILPPDYLSSIKPTDTLKFDLSPSSGALELVGNLNHRVFSVIIDKNKFVWVGTANGINKSIDGGVSWKKFSYNNQSSPISGNFVVALYEQNFNNKKIIWASTINAESQNEKRGVSFTIDDGITWKQTLLGEFAHNFASYDSVVYVATDNGIFRSDDFGNSWIKNGSIFDLKNNYFYTSNKFYSVARQKTNFWAGGTDGLVSTFDSTKNQFGRNWLIYRTSQKDLAKLSYAFPNPFSPDDEVVRIRYSLDKNSKVTLRIFDFGMNLVKTLLQNYDRNANSKVEEIWNGKDEVGNFVANGIYFYQLTIDSQKSDWGKILVIQ